MKAGIVVAIAGVLAAPPLFGEKPRWSSRSEGAGLRLGDAFLDISRSEVGVMIHVHGPDGKERSELRLLENKKVLRVVATSVVSGGPETPPWDISAFVGIGAESLSDDGTELEYWMVLGQGRLKDFETNPQAQMFRRLPRLMTRPVDRPFDVLGVGLPGGDSLMLTPQDLTRKRNSGPDEIETHTFVDHCPSPTGVVLQHYVLTSMELRREQEATSKKGE